MSTVMLRFLLWTFAYFSFMWSFVISDEPLELFLTWGYLTLNQASHLRTLPACRRLHNVLYVEDKALWHRQLNFKGAVVFKNYIEALGNNRFLRGLHWLVYLTLMLLLSPLSFLYKKMPIHSSCIAMCTCKRCLSRKLWLVVRDGLHQIPEVVSYLVYYLFSSYWSCMKYFKILYQNLRYDIVTCRSETNCHGGLLQAHLACTLRRVVRMSCCYPTTGKIRKRVPHTCMEQPHSRLGRPNRLLSRAAIKARYSILVAIWG